MKEEKIGFIVAYHHPDDKEKFDERYQRHLKVFKKNAEKFVQSAIVLKVDDAIFYQLAIVQLRQGIDFNTMVNSPEMKILVDDVLEFVPEDKFKVFPITERIY